ncbi:MAG TPA: DUF4349 domain-containing protein [Dehalococcoidia bacterium]|nr:DUF4349 domain-containing protein [Dehalococcoidia bacterium]
MAGWIALKTSGLAAAAALVFSGSAACGSPKSQAVFTDRGQSGTAIAAPTLGAPSLGAPSLGAPSLVPPSLGVTSNAAAASGNSPAPPPVTGGGSSAASEAVPGLDQKIVRTASVGLVAEDPEAAVGGISSIAGSLGGYVAQSNLSRSENRLRGTITIRVPVEGFDTAMVEIKRLGVRVDKESVAGQDVTQEYADSQARVRNLEATEEQLRLLLGTVRENTNRTEDILTVYRELTNIQGQIEQAKGRIQYLDKVSALASLTIEVAPVEVVAKEAPSNVRPGWSPVTTLRNATGTLGHAAQAILDVAIWVVVVVVPVALILLVSIALAYVAGRRGLAILGRRPAA